MFDGSYIFKIMKGERNKLRYLQLVAIIFFTVSGGPYGLEPLMVYAGKHAALLLLLLVPLIWDIPSILTVLELNSMMPVTGGYYQWVKKAFGLRLAFYEGWWTWLYTFVDLAIYPVLFVQYGSFLIPSLEHYKFPVCLLLIWSGVLINVRGIKTVGRASVLLSAIVLIPFLLVVLLFFFHHPVAAPALSFRGLTYPSLGMAMYTILWNFMGWDNATTYAGEIKQAVRTYIISMLIAFVCVFLIYFATVLTAVQSGVSLTQLNDQGFPLLGKVVAGQWLATMIALGGMASCLGLFFAVLLSVARVPKVMAEDKLLPSALVAEHARFKTPYVSIIVCGVVVSAMCLWRFGDLILIDVTLYGAGFLLEFFSLIALRKRAPQLIRPFRIPLNRAGLCVMISFPVLVLIIALSGSFMATAKTMAPAIFSILALLSAEPVWRIIQRVNKKTGNAWP